MKPLEENEDDLLDRRYPRDYSWKRALVYSSIGTIGMSMFLISISMLVSMCISGCAPVVTSHTGYVIHMDSEIIAVEHERMDKRGYGIVRYYEFPLGHDYKIGDSLKIPSTQLSPNEPSKMVDKNNR